MSHITKLSLVDNLLQRRRQAKVENFKGISLCQISSETAVKLWISWLVSISYTLWTTYPPLESSCQSHWSRVFTCKVISWSKALHSPTSSSSYANNRCRHSKLNPPHPTLRKHVSHCAPPMDRQVKEFTNPLIQGCRP